MLEWLEKQKGKVEQTTYIGYEQVIKGRLYKYFKAKKIKLIDLKPKHIQDFFDLLFSEGLSGNTIKHYRANISKALKSAVITEIIDSNPATKLEPIKVKEYKNKYEENKKFFGNTYVNDYSEYICLMENGELMKPGFLSQKFSEILDKNNLRHIRLHDLRHSCGTLLNFIN